MSTATEAAALLVPAIRWDAAQGFDAARPMIERALELGVGGFILFGGPAEEVRALTRELHARSRLPLLVGADLERGAGQQFAGMTGLPPRAALASLEDGGEPGVLRAAARLTAVEARRLGVNWVYGPVCDLDVEPDNPIVGTRALASRPARAAELAAEWIDGCQGAGVLACAKHFPGHGRTRGDSHMELPVVHASARTLEDEDLAPFRAAIDAGVAAVMTAHVAYPALDPRGVPATLSRPILHDLLRQRLGFDGLVVTDALIMEGVHAAAGAALSPEVRALAAGCDLLLYPRDVVEVARAVERALRDGALDPELVRGSLRRRQRWAEWAAPAAADVARAEPLVPDAWGDEVAERAVHLLRGRAHAPRGEIDVVIVDDDVGGPYPPPSREPLLEALAAQGAVVRDVTGAAGGTAHGPLVIALFGDIRSWKGRPGYSAASRAAVAGALARAREMARDAVVLQFSHPRLAAELTAAPDVVCAWGGEAVMQRAAARWLLRRR
ncbi:MAG TPA: glycoside hydrolase family 3 N-terminal domain-containing protein [Gemmatimonadaceae bacterium]